LDEKIKCVKQMTQAELITLEELRKNGPSHRPRERAHILLLSHKGHSISELSKLFELHRSSVSTTISNWKENGIAGLFDSSRTGRPPIIRRADEEEIVSKIIDSPRSLKKVIVDVGKSLNIFLSISTIKRYAKKFGFSWKRVRKSLRNKRNQQDFEKAQSEISILLELANEDGIELYYFDESGFNLTPNVPYAWQKKGTTIEIPYSRSKNINVLGFFSSTGKKLVFILF
jgi:transposase